MNIPLFPLQNNVMDKIIKCILQDQDLKTAKRLFQKNKNKPDFVKEFTDKLRSDYISAESLCSMVLFLNKFPEIDFQISEKALKNCCSYYNNLSSSLDETVILKNKDFINRLFPLFAEKNAFYWIMAFDCIYQNMRSTRRYKLQTTNKYLKSLNLRQFIQLFVKCLENIQYEKNYGTSNNFSFSAAAAASSTSDDGGDSFQQDIENTSIQIKHKQQIQSLQIFAQRLVLHVYHLKLETKFWQVLRTIYEKNNKNRNLNLKQELIQAGLPWLIIKNKNDENEDEKDEIKEDYVLTSSLATEMILPFLSFEKNKNFLVYFPKHLIKKNKNKTRLYLPFLKSYSLDTILCNEELFFQLESKKFTPEELVHAIQISDPEKLLKEKLIEFFQTEKLSLDPKVWIEEKKMFLFFETNLYLILQDKCIPAEKVFEWTETTGHVNLDPRFLAKINFGTDDDEKFEKFEKLHEKFYKIQRLVNP